MLGYAVHEVSHEAMRGITYDPGYLFVGRNIVAEQDHSRSTKLDIKFRNESELGSVLSWAVLDLSRRPCLQHHVLRGHR